MWGLMHRHNDWQASMCEASRHTGVVMACVEAFCHTITQKTVVVIDNASLPTRDDFAERLPSGKKPGLIIKYLRPYSPA